MTYTALTATALISMGDCLLALDARTGKRLWYFQFVHHDLWDYDPAAGSRTSHGAARGQEG